MTARSNHEAPRRARPGARTLLLGAMLLGALSCALLAPAAQARSQAHAHHKRAKPALHGNPLRAQLAFSAMQKHYYIAGMKGVYAYEMHARLIGLRNYLDTSNSGQPEGTFTSTLAAFDATVAPPAGPGGTKYYDDNDWVGIELARTYELTHSPTALGSAEAIMAFEMAGWQENPEL